MKIFPQQNYPYANIPKKTSFKGYFACPIKELHIQSKAVVLEDKKIPSMIQELNEKCGKYFDILIQLKDKIVKPKELKLDNEGFIKNALKDKWGQDNKLFLEDDKLLVLQYYPKSDSAENLAELIKIKPAKIDLNIEGGNCFLGKKPNGENFALVGENALFDSNYDNNKKYLDQTLKVLNIKPENLYVISQPHFHIDMVIRPLNYPYILVGDKELIKDYANSKAKIKFIESLNPQKTLLTLYKKESEYAPIEDIMEQLKYYGFIPIKVPGLAGDGDVNFMNAIVHQKPNGKLIYITNKQNLKLKEQTGIDFEKIFKKHMKENVPQIEKVIFIDGNGHLAYSLKNITDGGGIHCMNCERPDFSAWKKLLSKNQK